MAIQMNESVLVVERTMRQIPGLLYMQELQENPKEWLRMKSILKFKDWKDIEQVYICKERREVTTQGIRGPKVKEVVMIGVYFQAERGKMDYKYMHGVDFLIPTNNALKDVMNFLRGGWTRGEV